jgi:protein-disulfide isomerase
MSGTDQLDSGNRTTTRRKVLVGATALGVVGLAGCRGKTSRASKIEGTPTAQLPQPVMGNPDADVTVQIFEDFGCGHCQEFNDKILPPIKSQYIDPGKIRYEHWDFPNPTKGLVSWQAPNAARSVQKREGDEAFWEYSKLLFDNQDSLDAGKYEGLANQVDADGEAVKKDAIDERFNETIIANKQAGKDRDVKGTPAVFVNGTNLRKNGGLSSSNLARLIEQELGGGSASAGNSTTTQ